MARKIRMGWSMFLSPKETVELYINASVAKTKLSTGKIIGKSIFAGMMIAMGAACSNVAVHAIDNVGVARLVAGCVFPVGLMMVILMGAELFTGDCLMAIAVADKKIKALQFVKVLALVYFGNFIGGFATAATMYLSGQFNYSTGRLGAYTIKVALGKVTLTPIQGIASGVLCNILVCAAVIMAMSAKDVSGKLLVSFFVIMPFVTGGFEHCVANMYYISAGLIAKLNPAYVEAAGGIYGLTDLSALGVKGFLINNLIPVTIGNIIGGSLCIGIPMFLLNYKESKKK